MIVGSGGGGGIRTPETLSGLTVFKTAGVNRCRTTLNDDGSLYDPELMYEVIEAVKRENLTVDTVFAMHQGPLPWTQVVALLEKTQHS